MSVPHIVQQCDVYFINEAYGPDIYSLICISELELQYICVAYLFDVDVVVLV